MVAACGSNFPLAAALYCIVAMRLLTALLRCSFCFQPSLSPLSSIDVLAAPLLRRGREGMGATAAADQRDSPYIIHTIAAITSTAAANELRWVWLLEDAICLRGGEKFAHSILRRRVGRASVSLTVAPAADVIAA